MSLTPVSERLVLFPNMSSLAFMGAVSLASMVSTRPAVGDRRSKHCFRPVGTQSVTHSLTCGSTVDDKVQAAADAHAVGIDQADAQQGGNGGVHGRAVLL